MAFPIERLADAAVDLTRLFAKHGYDEAIIFGHAKDGNLHFVITQSFNDQAAIDRYARFMDDVVELVVKKYDGALKAEHGTGRNMAPFVEAEWGPEAKAVMAAAQGSGGSPAPAESRRHPQRRSQVPSRRPQAHARRWKRKSTSASSAATASPSAPAANSPSRPASASSCAGRWRASKPTVRDPALLCLPAEAFPYMALDTCAVDGLCATACPVGIDTGQLTKRFRRASHVSGPEEDRPRAWRATSPPWSPPCVSPCAPAIWSSACFGPKAMPVITRMLKAFGARPPVESRRCPRPRRRRCPSRPCEGAQAIYFPACISRMMGHLPGESEELSLVEALRDGRRSGPAIPSTSPRMSKAPAAACPSRSKGYDEAHQFTREPRHRAVLGMGREGRLPVVMDTSPCTYGLLGQPSLPDARRTSARFDRCRSWISSAFAHDVLLPRLTCDSQGEIGGAAPRLFRHQNEPAAEAGRHRQGLRRQGGGASRCGLLRLRGRSRFHPSRTDGIGHKARGRAR